MSSHKGQLIVALDVSTLEEARELVDILAPAVDIFKIGSQLFTACGPAAVRFVQAREKKVFLDLKYHDIPNTVARAVDQAIGLSTRVQVGTNKKTAQDDIGRESIFMYTMHIVGGTQMLEAAVEATKKKARELKVQKPLAVGITVLTSEKKEDSIQSLVLERAKIAKEAGLDGVVASVEEAPAVRQECGEDFIIVTPGIRPVGSESNDQQRIATPQKAIQSGSNFLVIGRPIVQAKDPFSAAKRILDEIESSPFS